MSYAGPASTTSPKGRLQFLLEEPSGSQQQQRLPDRGRVRDATRALSADAALGAGNPPPLLPPPPRSVDWLPRPPAVRQHSADSLSSNGSVDIAAAAHAAAFRDDSSESGSASGCSPRARPLPAPSMLPASHLLQSSAYGGVFNMAGFTAPSPAHPSLNITAPTSYAHPQRPGQAQTQSQPQSQPQPQPQPQPQAQAQPHHAHAQVQAQVQAAAAAARIAPAAHGSNGAGPSSSGRSSRGQAKTEQQMKERHDQRKMKNRISAAASRDRKKRSFNNLQRSLQDMEMKYSDARRIIETLTLQLEECRGRLAAGESSPSVPLPEDLRHLAGGTEYVSVQQLIDLLRQATTRHP